MVCVGKDFQTSSVQDMGHAIPITLTKVLNLNQSSSVVCPSCDLVYEYNDCFQRGSDDQQESKRCSHIDFPNHPQASRRLPCGTLHC